MDLRNEDDGQHAIVRCRFKFSSKVAIERLHFHVGGRGLENLTKAVFHLGGDRQGVPRDRSRLDRSRVDFNLAAIGRMGYQSLPNIEEASAF